MRTLAWRGVRVIPSDPPAGLWIDVWAPLLPWRAGRSLGRTIYAQLAHRPSKRDVLIALAPTSDAANVIIAAVNAQRDARLATYLSESSSRGFEEARQELRRWASPCCDGTGIDGGGTFMCQDPSCFVLP